MLRNSLKWLPALIVPAVVAVGIVAVPMQAGAAVDLPDKSASEVLKLVSDSTEQSFSGTVSKTADIGLPNMEYSSGMSQSSIDSMSEKMPEGMEDFVPQGAATGALSGAEVKTFLEHGVSTMPGANGRFAQVSGLCFTYDIAAPVGNRVTSMVLQSATGSCSSTPLDTAASYTVSTNDFVAAGGDGYPNVLARFTTRNIMDQDVAAYIQAKTTIAPTLQDRIVCADSNGDTVPNCPAKS